MPSIEDLTRETALPSHLFPSDHLRLETIFSLDLKKEVKKSD